ncbi:uncharacterized protein LOC106161496 [Lingula anatina]|uniref:Uncharacterized protein LOC106161496 n=1 Tax=Lingula anatina TaxID=7574 RepID=A0A1S3I6T1_LINAN|nr:uncharacterized protein LOC106161496 [Lingula anatina]|eukprot:XP_013393918.1 uncharacterized protein LOC106161496 [Lingula anatina]
MLLRLLLMSLGVAVVTGDVRVVNSWNDGFEGYITAPVGKDHANWTLTLIFDKPLWQLEIWEADIVGTELNNRVWHIKNKDYNGAKKQGESVAMNFVARGPAKWASVSSLSGNPEVKVMGAWDGGFEGYIIVPVSKSHTSWTLGLIFDQQLRNLEASSCSFTMLFRSF